MGKGAIVCIMDCTLTPKTTGTKAGWRLSREGLDPFTLSQESGFSILSSTQAGQEIVASSLELRMCGQ